MSMRWLLRHIVQLAALAALLILVLYLVSGLAAPATPAGQTPSGTPAPGIYGITEQNDAAAYAGSYGYQVDASGHPAGPDGAPDPNSAVMLMPAQSPQFDRDLRNLGDPGTVAQVTTGFAALERAFDAPKLGVGLEWGPYIVMFSATAEDVRAWQGGTLSAERFWAGVAPTAQVIDAQSWRRINDTGFLYKDFTGSGRLNEKLPPAVERPSSGGRQIRLQPSTAYLPGGSEATLVATLTDSSAQPVAGESVTFTYALPGEDPQPIATATTGPDGAARARFTPPSQAAGDLTVSVAVSGLPSGASTSITTAPPVEGSAATGAVATALQAQGFSVLDVVYGQQQGVNVATAAAEMVAPRLDMSVRSQILTMAGTLFAVYPQAAVARSALLYRTEGNSYQLIFETRRQDWEAWTGGATTEAQLWERLPLDEVVDALTGERVNQRDFLNKNFKDAVDRVEIRTPRSVESRLVRESWGDQLYTAKFSLSVGAIADSFTVEELTSGAGFAIYAVADPVDPLYRSSADPDGSGLRGLQLTSGNYLLSVEGNVIPSTIRLGYLDHLVDTARTGP
jgi:hypothetical protein